MSERLQPQRERQPDRGGMSMRLRGLVRKEFLQIVRDPSSIAIAFLMPVALLLLFGYGVSLDSENVPVAVVVEQPGPDSADFVSALQGSRYFAPEAIPTMPEATKALIAGKVDAILRLRANFAEQLRRPDGAPIQVIVNGINANNARITQGYIDGAWSTWLAKSAREQGRELAIPVRVEHRVWFNSELRSRNYLVPGLVVVIMTLIGALLTAMVMAREWERGTMEALMVTPVGVTELLLGKLIPYFVMGTGGLLLSVAMAVFLFHVPLRGSLWLLMLTGSLFLLVALGMGLLISSVAKNQFIAGQLAIITTFLPAFLLSGFIFDIGSMPQIVRLITHIVAARYFVAIANTLFLAGNVWSVILPNAFALLLMAAIFLGLTWRKTRKRLE
ncbi:MAG: ABC transporter permease [Burkholderiales bacterium]